MVVPVWQTQPWWPMLLEMMVEWMLLEDPLLPTQAAPEMPNKTRWIAVKVSSKA